MNPEEREEYWRLVNAKMSTVHDQRRADPQEGDVVSDVYGTQVYLGGKWNDIDYTKPDEVQELREKWVEMTQGKWRKPYAKTIGKSTGGVHLHLGEDDDADLEDVEFTATDMDVATLKAFNDGLRSAYSTLLEELTATEESLKQYGRTDLYGVRKAIDIVEGRLKDVSEDV